MAGVTTGGGVITAMNADYIYDIWRITSQPRTEVEAEIRALCKSAYLGDHTSICRVLGRYKMYMDTRDIGIASHLMLEGYWEMWVTEAMMRAVRRGSTVMDIGANLGYFSVLLADLTGPQGRLLSFEPNPEMASRLRKSVKVNGFAGFSTVHECALGYENGYASMDIDTTQPGGGRMIGHSGQRRPMPVRRLDEIEGALDVEFIKMDVEGFEQNVWYGMTGILAQKRPLTIFMEFTVGRFADPAGFLDEIAAEDFSLEIIDHNQGVRAVTREEIFGQSHGIDHMLVFRR
jgi:FkbM family methyltransferase